MDWTGLTVDIYFKIYSYLTLRSIVFSVVLVCLMVYILGYTWPPHICCTTSSTSVHSPCISHDGKHLTTLHLMVMVVVRTRQSGCGSYKGWLLVVVEVRTIGKVVVRA